MGHSGYRGVVHVEGGHVDLGDAVDDRWRLADDDDADESVGMVRVELGHVRLLVGVAVGRVRLAVVHHDRDPGADPGYEDIVEIDVEVRTGELFVGGTDDGLPLAVLPFGPGRYRLRYHARGMDLAGAAGGGDRPPPVGEYFAQLWPAAPADREVVKVTSRCAQRLLARVAAHGGDGRSPP